MAAVIHDKVTQIIQTLATAQTSYESEPPGGGSARIPLDPRASLRSEAAELESLARSRGVGISIAGGELLGFAVADPDSLRRLFRSALALLISDARPGTEIRAATEEKETTITYHLRNDGFGMPGERLKGFLASADPVGEPYLEALRAAAREAGGWGGGLESDATPGDGTVLRITLPRFA